VCNKELHDVQILVEDQALLVQSQLLVPTTFNWMDAAQIAFIESLTRT